MRRCARALVLAAAAFAGACGGSEGGGSTVELGGLRRAGAPPSYWLGERFEGLTLVANVGDGSRPSFVYGTCEIPPGSDGGCAPPLQLQHWPLAQRAPSMFRVTPDRRAACRLVGDGAPTAAAFETSGGVEVYVGETVVVLFGETALVRKALEGLRPVSPQEEGLPTPPDSVHAALRRCAPLSPTTKLAELRRAEGPAVYWLGTSFGGHPLATAEGDRDDATFVYGECARELKFDLPCWAPIELRVGPSVSPGAYAASIDCVAGEVRGVPTALLPGAHTLDVFAGDRTARLIGEDLELLRDAAAGLRRIDEDAPASPLPPPPASVARAVRERCR